MKTIGVLALQGAFIEHVNHIEKLGHKAVEIRKKDQLEGIDGIKTEHEVIDVIFAVRSTVKQFEERMKELDTLTGGILLVCSQHTLRLVDNQNRVRLGDRYQTNKYQTLRSICANNGFG